MRYDTKRSALLYFKKCSVQASKIGDISYCRRAKAKKVTKKANKTITPINEEANFQLDLPDDFDEDTSDDDSVVTVVSPKDRAKEKQDDNTYINGSVKKMINYPDLEVKIPQKRRYD